MQTTLSKIINLSLISGNFPGTPKEELVRSLLERKKSFLDPIVLSNYLPVSNLPYVGKVKESVVAEQLQFSWMTSLSSIASSLVFSLAM